MLRSRFGWLFCVVASIVCSTSASADPRLAYVNGGPQFNVTDRFFALYIGVWRGFDANELGIIEGQPYPALIAKRKIEWQVTACDHDFVEHKDQEIIWTLDRLVVGQDNLVKPIAEAHRPGFRYFSLANIHGLFLRGTGDFRRPAREPGETSTIYRERVESARAAWWESASPKGTHGVIIIDLDMRLVAGVDTASERSQFIAFDDYAVLGEDDPALYDLFYRTAPNRWPINYDERAHKPHTFFEPAIWQTLALEPYRQDFVQARFEWNWCDTTLPLEARVVLPRGGRLQEGPNRNGRTDHGPVTIEIVEE